MSFQVDPDALTASSKLASKQRDHIGAIDDYISSSCSNFGAFSGVLTLFQGSYESAVSTAHDGLRDSRAVATKVSDAFLDTRDDYLDTDQSAYDRFRGMSPNPADFPPYDPAGSGNGTPSGPVCPTAPRRCATGCCPATTSTTYPRGWTRRRLRPTR